MENKTDSSWNFIVKIGGIAAILQLVTIGILIIIMSLFPTGELTRPIEYFTLLAENRLVGILSTDLSSAILIFLSSFTIFGIFIVMKDEYEALSTFIIIFTFMGIILALATNSALSIINLSDRYAVSTSDTMKEQLIIAGEAVLAFDMWNNTAGYFAGILMQGGFLIISIAMLQTDKFSKVVIYSGIIANGVDLLQHIVAIFVPAIAEVVFILAGPAYIVWYISLSLNLYKLSSNK